ncbi:MAG: helix-turn-helix domain-containing protein [Cyanobacteria bacterium P01_G01_bin.54]
MTPLAIQSPQTPEPLESIPADPSSPLIQVERALNPPGEGGFCFEGEHTVSMLLNPRPLHYVHRQDGKTFTGLVQKGEFIITPAQVPLFARWQDEEDYLQIRLKTQFLQKIALETLSKGGDRLELRPTFRTHDPQVAAIASMFLTELNQQQAGNQLYLDSLANLLAVQLLRHHATTQPQLPSYTGGLPQRQLLQILDYIDAHLDQNLRLESLAQLLDMSQFHFSRLFKQSLGLSPHQYLLQQRIERAKQLLKQTDQSILDIALAAGFNSHSHLSRQFRQWTGMTPKAYRAS